MKEEVFNFGKSDSLVGIFTPSNCTNKHYDFCVILLNAGVIHKVGPNRLHVKIARELSNNGICCFRFDYYGLGDSNKMFIHEENNNFKEIATKSAMEKLTTVKGYKVFILCGICSGAEDAFSLALVDNRVRGLILIDGIFNRENIPKSLFALAKGKTNLRYYKKSILKLSKWKKLLSLELEVQKFNIIKLIIKKIKNIYSLDKNKCEDIMDQSKKEELNCKKEWEYIITNDIKTKLIFCEGGNAIDIFNLTTYVEIKSMFKSQLLDLEIINNFDHTVTPIWAQKLLISKINDWLNRNYNSIE